MARLGRLAEGTPVALELLQPGSNWRLTAPVDLTSHWQGLGLATQAASGRVFTVMESVQPGRQRLRVCLREDGYPGWLDPMLVLGHARACLPPQPRLLDAAQITAALPAVLAFAERARQQPNHYLWGGTLGPDFDCSGLIQAAFAQSGIWLPRDAYQQERFCQPVAVAPGCSCPVSLKPTTWGISIVTGWPSMAASASMPPTPQPSTPRPLIIVVCESVPTRVSG